MAEATIDAEGWFWISRSQAEEHMTKHGWPFTNVTVEQFYSLTDMLSIKKNLQSIIRVVGTSIPGFGTVCTLLLIATLWRRTFVEKNTFFAGMVIIASLDLTFNVLDFTYNFFYREWKLTGFWSKEAMWIVVIMRGMAYSASLASDICALWVTVERYVAISQPQLYRNLSIGTKRWIWCGILSITFLLGACRMHYALTVEPVPAGGVFVYTSSWLARTDFVIGLAIFSDTALPIALIVVTFLLSTKFRLAIIKRQKSKKAFANKSNVVVPVRTAANSNSMVSTGNVIIQNQHSEIVVASAAPAPALRQEAKHAQQNESSLGQKSAIILTYTLDVFLIADNLGYVMYFAADIMETKTLISYQSTYEELLTYCQVQRFESFASLTLITLEGLTRALNFPVYMALSGSMRKEFRDVVKRVLKL